MTNPYDQIIKDIDRKPSFKRRWTVRLIFGGFIALMIAGPGVAAFPSLIKLTQPLLCSNGEIITQKHHLGSGTTREFTIAVHCLKPNGEKSPVGTFISIVTLFALLLFPCMIGIAFLGQVWKWHMIRKYGPNYKEQLRRSAQARRQRYAERQRS